MHQAIKTSGVPTAAFAALAISFGFPAIALPASPFASFQGNWTGAGTITTDGGSRERIRCKAHYELGNSGGSLAQNLTCASDSYNFHVISTVQANGDSLSGEWSETNRDVSGAVSGRIGRAQISAYVSGTGFSATIGIAARGAHQSVTISPTGSDITNVSLTMSKS